jgi:hypothetical protein|tara:strand:+ start:135 stop:491 length:357 start_codon:yes stop_codon:yes gene_type:complete
MMILPITIKSRNVLDRQHWAKKSVLKKEYALLIRNQMRLNNIEEVTEPKKLNLNIVSTRKRLLDYDNLVGGCKQLIDALIEENYIYDDSPKWLELSVQQVLNKDCEESKHNKTLIRRY